MIQPILFNQSYTTEVEHQHIARVLADGELCGDGEYTKKAQKLLQNYFGYSTLPLLTTSCTHALEMSALLLNIQEGDEVIMPSFTFVSTANAFILRGAKLVFVDIRSDTLNINEELIEQAITAKTRAIVPVHYAGVGCEMEKIMKIANQYNLIVVEDNAHGLFGTYNNRPLGTFGALSTLSFHSTKNITCGEGGALVINNHSFAERAEILREKGTNRSSFFRGQVDKYTWVDIGSSYVLSDILAACLVGQLERNNDIQKRRQYIWSMYHTMLNTWSTTQGIQQPTIPDLCKHPAHLYYLVLPSISQRTNFIQHMKEQNIQTSYHYQPLHTSLMGQQLGYTKSNLPITESVADCLVRLPIHLRMTDEDIQRVCDTAIKFTVTM